MVWKGRPKITFNTSCKRQYSVDPTSHKLHTLLARNQFNDTVNTGTNSSKENMPPTDPSERLT